MKQKFRLIFFISFFLSTIFPPFLSPFSSTAFASGYQYSYDETNRLTKVTSGNERMLYRYDEAGNLLSIEKENNIPQALPPVLQGTLPEVYIIGVTHHIVITGQNLISTTALTSDNPHITISNIRAIDTKISATLSIDGAASYGQSTLTVTTLHGQAALDINLYDYNITPLNMALLPFASNNFSVNLVPSAAVDFNGIINNKTRDIIFVPSTVFIPAGGIGNITVNTLKSGTGSFTMGTKEAEIFVLDDGTVLNTAAVSVYIDPYSTQITNSSITARPLSVYIDQATKPVTGAVSASAPLSVFIGLPQAVTNTVTVGSPVSVSLGQ